MSYMYEKVGKRKSSWVMRRDGVGWGGGQRGRSV